MTISNSVELLYQGKTSEISEELAEECVFIRDHEFVQNVGTYQGGYKNYLHEEPFEHYFKTAKESINSACSSKYCIIYKTK